MFPGTQGGPLEHVIAAKAVAFRQAMSPEFRRDMAQTVANAKALAAGFDFSPYRSVCDVGGASGLLSITLAVQ